MPSFSVEEIKNIIFLQNFEENTRIIHFYPEKKFIFTLENTNITISGCYIYDISTIINILVPEEYKNTVISFVARNCGITKIPVDFFDSFPMLETIDLYANSIETLDFNIPPKCTSIDISYNKLNKITSNFPDTFEYINLEYNFLNGVPPNVVNFGYKLNNNDFDIGIVYRRIIANRNPVGPINNFRNPDDIRNIPIRNPVRNQVLDNNVHDNLIQNTARKTIEKLVDSLKVINKNPKYIDDLLEIYLKKVKKDYKTWIPDFIIKIVSNYRNFKELLYYYHDEYINNDIIYSYDPYLLVKINFILERICSYALINEPIKDNIIEQLFIEMKEGKPVCFVGKYTRLLNVCTLFMDGIDQIPVNDKITNKLDLLRKNKNSKEFILTEMKKYMIEIGLSEEEYTPWLEAIQDTD